MNEICDALEAGGETYKAYFTGSRGYHIHIFWYQYALLDKLSREGIRGKIISMFKADVLKSSDKVMIAVEGMPHWKTGNMKKLVRQYPKTWDD
jgi:DNA primase catalytic subunit